MGNAARHCSRGWSDPVGEAKAARTPPLQISVEALLHGPFATLATSFSLLMVHFIEDDRRAKGATGDRARGDEREPRT